MKTLEYIGFSGTPCSCQYQIFEVDGQRSVIFVQGALTQTSITNLIEVLASKILSGDLFGFKPSEVRFFEHYPPRLQPLREWQEVIFAESMEVRRDGGLISKLLDAIQGKSPLTFWTVDDPRWKSVPPALASKLAATLHKTI